MTEPYERQWGKIDGYAIWLVDAPYIRKNIDINFTDMDQHFHRRYIPKGEVWIDSATSGKEVPFMARSGVKEAKLMGNGESFVKADEIADRAERAERKNDPAYHDQVRLDRLGSNGKVTVWLVKGEAVRDRMDIDYTEGGHGRVYRWIPRTEIWLDDATKPEDRPFNFLHELYEYNQMGKGLGYENAHHKALRIELQARRHPREYAKLIDRQMALAGGIIPGLDQIAGFRQLMR